MNYQKITTLLIFSMLISSNTVRCDSLSDGVSFVVGGALCFAAYKTLPHTRTAINNLSNDPELKKAVKPYLPDPGINPKQVAQGALKDLVNNFTNPEPEKAEEKLAERLLMAGGWTAGTGILASVGAMLIFSSLKSFRN